MKRLIILSLIIISTPVFVFAEGRTIDTGTTAWMLTSTTLVLLMIPGLAMFYGGLVRTKNVLGTMMHSFSAMAVIGVLWTAVGYCFSFGDNILGGFLGWDTKYIFLNGIDSSILAEGIPEYVYAMFQGKFAIIAPALIAGAFAERVNFKSYLLFIAAWSLLVYNPLCHWVWSGGGFLAQMGAIDFAGGTVIHISSGISGLVIVLYLGARRGYPRTAMQPNNLVMTLMGAGLLWVGWFGFNAGSAVSSGLDTARALTLTQVAASSGALAWMVIEIIHHKKATSLGFVSGVLAGLVAITPAAGVVTPLGAFFLGIIASIFCYGAILIKNRLGYDDSLDVFGIHGTGGIVGALALVLFLRSSWTESRDAGWTLFSQFSTQGIAVLIAILYSAFATLIITLIIQKTIGFRLEEKKEIAGLDQSEHAEQGYGLIHIN
ncbi:MAG TPA: ammonium transporter [Spirochaetota bacterium]|nr:ammonium transporter [Spirochaetota bacterium]HPJ41635.1 ammonium transporter [Spirochaetota bacterium]HPR36693.1 ammonium transporter [Spirochaetota bacterium]